MELPANQSKQKIRLGINGFGRIGRAVAKIAMNRDEFDIVAVNELSDNIDNAVYLYNYDSTYGRSEPPIYPGEADNTVVFGDQPAVFYNYRNGGDVPWEKHDVDILIEATGITENVAICRSLVKEGRIRKAIVTHSPDSGVDRYVLMGVNDDSYDPDKDHVVSSVICDTNAIAHVLAALDEAYGIETGFVTTLHPWLSYQNLVDGPVEWQSSPGSYWTDFSLGRSSIGSLIPKNTTAISCLSPFMPEMTQKLSGFSYRIPTDVVCSADMTLKLDKNLDKEALEQFLQSRFSDSPYVKLNYESLVSVDFKGLPYSAFIDCRWLQVMPGNMVKIVLWYDNEWGYSSRVIDIASMLATR